MAITLSCKKGVKMKIEIDWLELIHKLNLKGLSKQLALHSELVQFSWQMIWISCESEPLAKNMVAIKEFKRCVRDYFLCPEMTVIVTHGKMLPTPEEVQMKVRDMEIESNTCSACNRHSEYGLFNILDGFLICTPCLQILEESENIRRTAQKHIDNNVIKKDEK